MKKKVIPVVSLLVAVIMVLAIGISGCSSQEQSAGTEQQSAGEDLSPLAKALTESADEEYYMVTFLSGIEYWKGCYKGFEAAGKVYGVKTAYEGAADYDVNQAVTVLEQVIANKPAGLAISCINPDAYIESIKNAMADGIPVVTFDADSPGSGRYAFLATGNKAAGAMAAKYLAESLNGEGQVALVTLPGQLNHEERVAGFVETIESEFPNMEVVQIVNGGGEQTSAAQATAGVIQANPDVKGFFCTDATSGVGAVAAVEESGKSDIKIVSFDTDKGTLDAIKAGSIEASIAQGTWNMGYWAFQFIYQLNHGLINPVEGWQEKGINPLPPVVDTGVNVVTKDNVDAFYTD